MIIYVISSPDAVQDHQMWKVLHRTRMELTQNLKKKKKKPKNMGFKLLPQQNILDLPQLKVFADNNCNSNHVTGIDMVENSVKPELSLNVK